MPLIPNTVSADLIDEVEFYFHYKARLFKKQ